MKDWTSAFLVKFLGNKGSWVMGQGGRGGVVSGGFKRVCSSILVSESCLGAVDTPLPIALTGR
jgi:hypothetical protein